MSDLDLESPVQAEAAFYAAIESANLDAMMAVWDKNNDIVCIHPQGPRLIGYREVRESWRQIMAHSPSMEFKICEYNRVENEDLAIHYVSETIHIDNSDEPEFTVLATNIYRRTASGWRIILHHASPTPESLQFMLDSEAEDAEERDDEVTFH